LNRVVGHGFLKTLFLKKIDGILGRAALLFLSAWVEKLPRPLVRRVLLIRPGGIGDAVLLIPAIRVLKSHFPDAKIDILAERRNGGIFSLSKDVRRILYYDRPKELFAVIRGKYDVVIDTEQWHRLSAVVARLAAKGVTVGYGTNERKRAFSHPVHYSHDDYEADSFFRLLEPLGITPPDSLNIPFLDLSDDMTRRVDELLKPLEGRPFVTLFPGASIPERRWGAKKFGELAIRVHGAGFGLVVVGGDDDWEEGGLIASAGMGLNLAGRCSLVESAAVIAKSTLLVSGDSGILHVGVGVGTPTVSLFGPGIARKWAPRGERHVVINKGLSCSPCTKFGYTPKCPDNARCLQEITVDEVFDAVTTLLQKIGTKKEN